MGFFDSLIAFLGFKRREVRIVVVGLDNSGKTTILQHFQPPEKRAIESLPTVGFTVEKFRMGKIGVVAFDMSGQSRYRSLWEHYYKDCQGLIFVIDSSDKLRLPVAKNEVELMLQHPDLRSKDVPLLVFANKTDIASSFSSIEVSNGLGLDHVPNRQWHICSSNAITGDGLKEGLEWLTQRIQEELDKK